MTERIEPRRLRIGQQSDGQAQWVGYLEAGQGPPLVLLHGIGSGASAWQQQLLKLSQSHRVIAWDAPGYADSTALSQPHPLALDYALVLRRFLQALDVQELVLLGHSLGALMAAAFAVQSSELTPKLCGLILASPARGYGSAAAEVKLAKWQERVQAIESLGAQRMGRERSSKLCAPGTEPGLLAQVAANMARVTVGGYSQASYLLAHDDIRGHLAQRPAGLPLALLCGTLDTVTPLPATQALAAELGAPCQALSGVGHLPYMEGPQAFNQAVLDFCHTVGHA